MKEDIAREIEVPQDVTVEIEGNTLIFKGAKGKLRRTFLYENIEITKKDNKVILTAKNVTRREKRNIGTILSHIKNMIHGAKEGYEYKLQICSVHFPMNVKFDSTSRSVIIKNFLGEVKERKANVLDNVDVEIGGEMITVTSADKESAGQTAANIEKATRIKTRDRRVFQDGIFIIKKADKKI